MLNTNRKIAELRLVNYINIIARCPEIRVHYFFFFIDRAPTEFSPLPHHDALPIPRTRSYIRLTTAPLSIETYLSLVPGLLQRSSAPLSRKYSFLMSLR